MNIALVGLGVIGGSIGLSLRGKIYGTKLQGIDLDKYTIDKAFELGIIERGAISSTHQEVEIINDADIIILSIYPSAIKKFIERNKNNFKSEAIIIDTSGVKNNLVNIDVPSNIDFILTHPMAGREKSGIDYASRKVFVGANFIITKTEKNRDDNIKQVEILARKMGFTNIVQTSVKDHDKIIAFTSQLPHAIAVALVNSDNLNTNTGSFTGDSYKEITRIANINENLWAELFFSNKNNLIEKIEDFQKELSMLKEAIEDENVNVLKTMFISATEKRREL